MDTNIANLPIISYNEKSFIDPEVEISIDDDFTESKTFALGFEHPNYLFCHMIDKSNGNLVHIKFDKTLQDYIDGKIETQTQKYWIQHTRLHVTCLSEFLQPILHGLVKFIVDLHASDRAIEGPFHMSNLVVKEDVVKFWKIGVVGLTPQNRVADFRNLCSVMKHIVGVGVPYDFRDLLYRIEKKIVDHAIYSVEDEVKYLRHHLCLLPTNIKMMFLKSCADKRKYFKLSFNALRYKNALYAMSSTSKGGPICFGWTRKFNKTLGPLWACYIKHTTGYLDNAGPLNMKENAKEK